MEAETSNHEQEELSISAKTCLDDCLDVVCSWEEIAENVAMRCVSVNRRGLRIEMPYMPQYFHPKFGCYWAPTIWFNICCYGGPFIDLKRLAEMPKCIGPGPLHLVLKKLMSHLLSAAVKPRDLFAHLAIHQSQHVVAQDRELVEIKAKYRNKRWKGIVDICKKTEHVYEWCRRLCTLLDACPCLVGLFSIDEFQRPCPYECKKMSKTKFSGATKPNSLATAKKLKRRMRSNNIAKFNDVPPRQPLAKRARLYKERPPPAVAATNHSRPTTRGAQLRFFEFKQNRHSSVSTENAALKNGVLDSVSDAKNNVHSTPKTKISKNGNYALDAVFGDDKHNDRVNSFHNVNICTAPVVSNPIHWSETALFQWLSNSEICKTDAIKLREEQIDGNSFMLLTLPDVQQRLGLKLGPALKLCLIIKHLKLVYLENYAESDSRL